MSPRPALVLLCVTAVAAVLVACGAKAGIVSGKDHDPASSYVTMQCVSTPTSACGTQIPVAQHRAECWRLDLRDGDDTGEVCVTEAAWTAAKVGDRWPPR